MGGSLAISSTSMHSILHEHLAAKKIFSRWVPHNLTNAQKSVRVDWCKEMLEKYDRDALKDVAGDGSMRISPKQNNSPQCESSKACQIQRKLFVQKSLRSKWSHVSSPKLLFHLSIVGRSIRSCTPQLVCLTSSDKFDTFDCPKCRIDGSSAIQP